MKKILFLALFGFATTFLNAQSNPDLVFIEDPNIEKVSISINQVQTIITSVNMLIVIDGIISTNFNYFNLSTSDIENTYLTQTTNVVYGNRGANGVIIISTKRGGYSSPLGIIQ